MPFEPAVREMVKLRAALCGPSGSGKTSGALDIATAIVEKWGGKIAVIDTNNGQAKLFADRYTFDHMDLVNKTPEGFVAAVREAKAARYAVLVIDTTSHEWLSVLAEADRFSNWKELTPRHNDCIAEMVSAPMHVIVTMRAKMKYGVDEVEEGGRKKQTITRLGVGPVQREGVEYEFDIFGYLDSDHEAYWQNRCDPLVGTHSTPRAAAPIIVEWLEKGDPPPWKAPGDIADALGRIALFVEDTAPWLKEAILARYTDEVTEWPEKYAQLPIPVRADVFPGRIGAVVRVLETEEGFDPLADEKKTRVLVRRAFSEGFEVDVKGPDPFHGPTPF